MIPKQLRPKYQIEQYIITFVFADNVQGTPVITVSMESGEDPNKDALAGLPFVQGSLVSCIILGGIPGNTYKISCAADVNGEEFIQEGLISVKHTNAVTPPDISPIPLSNVQSTTPYPYYLQESVEAESYANDGGLWQFPLDEVDAASHALAGIHRELIVYYSTVPESVDSVSYALAGVHRDLVVRYSMVPEGVDALSQALNGTQRVYVLRYLNYPPEGVDADSQALNGTHGPL